jgi:hypothetical protein
MVYICKLLMNYVLVKCIFNILNHVIFPAKIQISKPIDVSVFMFDLRMISMSSECEYHWYWKISACSTEYEVCDSFASLTRQQTSYSGSACWYFRNQSIHIHITYTYQSAAPTMKVTKVTSQALIQHRKKYVKNI